MNPIAQDVYNALEEVAENDEEQEQIDNARAKHRVKEAYQERKQGVYAAITTTFVPLLLGVIQHYNGGYIYNEADVLLFVCIAIAGWLYFAHKRLNLQDARIDYYCGTEVIDEVKDNE